jgi:PBSX family phage portal protein
MDAATHERMALDFLQMGNLFLQMVPNMAGRPLRYEVSPALYTRVGQDPGSYFWVKPTDLGFGTSYGDYEFPKGSVIHIGEPDVTQEIYGLPGWLSALNSGLLNESATLFRRRYYKNGGHAGFVFYATDAELSTKDWEAIKAQMRGASGRGNFKNLYVHVPNGKPDGIKIIPLAEVAAKDEFQGIKNISRDDMLAAHRVPPQLIGVIPVNAGGFSDPRGAMDVFFPTEIEPLMEAMMRVNDMTGLQVVQYRPYQPMAQGAPAPGPTSA